MMKGIQDCYELHNGVKIPCIGFGTWKLPNTQQGTDIIKTALALGYRHIDTAEGYENEKAVGKAVRTCGIPRKEIFVTSKLDNKMHGYENTIKAFRQTMENLELDYLDLFLIHWPAPVQIRDSWQEKNDETWIAMEELYKKGVIKAIGVSNFLEHHLEALMQMANIKPMVNQIEFHPQYVPEQLHKFCKKRDILVEAWSPFIGGKAFRYEILKEISEKYNKTVAQLCIAWSLQKGVLPLPKASSPERIKENMEVFDFEISQEDILKIKELELLGGIGPNPDTAPF